MSGIWRLVAIITGAGAACAGVCLMNKVYSKFNEISDNLGTSVNNIKDVSKEEITNRIIDENINKSIDETVNARVKSIIESVKADVMRDANNQLTREARIAVSDASKDIREKTLEKITDEVACIDIGNLRREVRDKAEEAILDKFNDDLGDLLEKYNRNLKNVMDIYDGISEAVNNRKRSNDDKTIRFSLGN